MNNYFNINCKFLIVSIIIVFISVNSWGQTYTVGTSSGVNLSNPFPTEENDSKYQYTLTKAELSAAGLSANSVISSIGYNIGTVQTHIMNGLTISIKHTTATTLSAFDNTGLNQVYTGNIAMSAIGWRDLLFQNDFIWNGTDNILIQVCYDNTTNAGSGNNVLVSFRGTGSSRAVYSRSKATGAVGCNLTSPSTSVNIPITRFFVTPGLTPSFSNFSANPALSTSFAHRKGANDTPKFTIKSSSNFNAVQFELNTKSNFTGTAFVSTISDGTTYNGATLYDFWTTTALTGTDQTYFTRCRVSLNGGTTYGPWTTELWPYSYFPSIPYEEEGWYYTTGEQFSTGVVQELTYNNISVNSTPLPDNGNITLNQGMFSITSKLDDGVKEGSEWFPSVSYMTIGRRTSGCTRTGNFFNGMKFSIPIPRNALVISTIFSVVASSSCPCNDQSSTLDLVFDAHAVDNAPVLDGTNVAALTGRTTANKSINYTPAWTNGTRYDLVSVENILQEIVNRPGWNAGNNFNLLARWGTSTPTGTLNRCVNQADNGATTAPRIIGTFTNYKNTVYFPTVDRAIYGPAGTTWDELIISDNTTCTSCYTEYAIHDAVSNAMVAGPFLRSAGLNGTQSFDISTVAAQNVFVSATVYRSNASPQINDIWLTTNLPSPLPIELTSFSVKCDTEGNTLINWETASESNSDYFLVQRSEDLITWTDIAKVSAQGTSTSAVKYHMTDSDATREINYYRLTQYDLNGDYEIFNPISSKCSPENFSVVLFPNPSNGNFSLKVESNEELKDVNISIFDVIGKIIYTEKVNFVIGTTLYPFSNLHLSKGSYLLKITSPKKELKGIPFLIY